MKVKVGSTIYDGEKQPVMVILSPEDKENIRNMPPELTKYCSYPDFIHPEEGIIQEFMKVED